MILPLRVRSKYDGKDTNFSYPYRTYVPFNTFSGAGTATETMHTWSHYDYMIDRINPKGANGFRRPGPCSRRTLSYTNLGTSKTVKHYYNPTQNLSREEFDLVGFNGNVTPSMIESVMTQVIPSAYLLTERLAAWNKFATQVPTQVSLFNTVLELKDFSKVAKSIGSALANPKNAALRVKKVPQSVKNAARSGKLHAVKSAPKIVNSTFLNWHFAWAPLVGDLFKLMSLSENLIRRINYLRVTRGKPVRVHYYKENFYSPTIGTSYLVYANSTRDVKLKLTDYRADFAASCTLYQDLQGLDDAWTEMRATFAALGFNNPLAIVWNAIPFSFLIDWILPINTLLKRLAVQPFSGRWDIYDVTSSVKESYKFTQTHHYWPYVQPGQDYNPAFDVATIHGSKYERITSLPLSLNDVGFTALDDTKQKLFFSLIAGNTLFRR